MALRRTTAVGLTFVTLVAVAMSNARAQSDGSSSAATLPATRAYPVMHIIDASKVDGVEQTFFVDFYLSLFWQDPNVENMTMAGAASGGVVPDAVVATLARNVDMEFVNKKEVELNFEIFFVTAGMPGSLTRSNAVEQYRGYPWIEKQTRYSGNFKAKLGLQDFPFDKQSIEVKLESVSFADTDVVFPDRTMWTPPAFAEAIDMVEWSVDGSTTTSIGFYYSIFDLTYSRFTWSVTLQRRSEYYVTKIITGIALLTVMSHMAFAIAVDDPNRAVIALTAFLGLVTYLFVLTSDVPKVAYLTRMDKFVSLSFFTVFIDFVASVGLYCIQYQANVCEARATAAAESLAAESATRYSDADNGEKPAVTHVEVASAAGGAAGGGSPVCGWWTRWNAWKRVIDLIIAAANLVVYGIATIVVLT